MDAKRWQAVSRYLDEALALPDAQRSAWLSSLEKTEAIIQVEAPLMSHALAEAAKDPAESIDIAAKRATTPEKLRRLLEGDLDTIVAKALKKDPRERYPSVTSMLEDFQRYLGQLPISARPDSLAYRCAKFVRRNRIPVALAAAAAIATLGGIVATSIEAHQARTQRDFAFRQLSRAEAINDLNHFILVQAAPSGKPFTVRELLGRAERVVAKQSPGNPLDRAVRGLEVDTADALSLDRLRLRA